MRASGVVRKFPLTRDVSGMLLHVVHGVSQDYSRSWLFEMTLEFNDTSVLHAFSLVKKSPLIKQEYAKYSLLKLIYMLLIFIYI